MMDNGRHRIKIGGVYIPRENIGKSRLLEAFNNIEKGTEKDLVEGYQTVVIGDTNAKMEDEGDSPGGKIQQEMTERLNLTTMNETDRCQGGQGSKMITNQEWTT